VEVALTAPAIVDADLVDISDIEADLQRRLDLVADDDDLIVMLGMVAAGEASADVLGSERARLSEIGQSAENVTRFQQLWYHFKVPFGEASLVWWYMFCLGLGREGDVGAALVRLDRQLAALGPEPVAHLDGLADLLGLSRDSVVITDDELCDVDALASAVRRGVALVWTDDLAAAAAATKAELVPQAESAKSSSWWLGPPADLTESESRVRARWSELAGTERDELLAMLGQKVTSIERMRFRLGDSITENKESARILGKCRETAPGDWPYSHLVLVTTLWCWYLGGFALQELNQSWLSLSSLTHYLVRRIREYGLISGAALSGIEHLDAVALAGEYAKARTQLEQARIRCMHFDGSNWERREFLLPRTGMERPHEIPDSLRQLLGEWIGVDFPGPVGTLEAWDRYLELALEAGHTPTRVVQALTQEAANARDLPLDMAVFTVPMGNKLLEPWTLVYADIFCYTAFRDGFQPAEHGIPGDLVSIQNIQGQRQRFNAVKKSQNYAPVRKLAPQGFNLPDISIAEDAHHAGHFAAGVRLACRVPITIFYRDKQWNGISDVRLNRVEYQRDNRFTPRDVLLASRYAQWVKGVADAAYRRDLMFNAKWGSRVQDLEL
jgi:hypothetical protein